ncbi:DUF6377 domain-containing protein [Geofilum sp. OHC36d9]|uniref:DUF6377 domain-containing protein n=1 Tax=Geofilum sp. OHC36d9 TaxID=3458413 RepID=UPI004033B746
MRSLFVFFFFIQVLIVEGATLDSQLEELENAIGKRELYTQEKMNRIDSLKEKLHLYSKDSKKQQEYQSFLELSYEYQSFVYDSAFFYIEMANQKAIQIQNTDLLIYSKIKQGFVLLSSGLFKEAIDTLSSLSAKSMPDSVKWEFYSVIGRSYYDLADYNQDPIFSNIYISIGNAYLDSALVFVPENTNDFWAIESLRRMKLADWSGAKYAFEFWMKNFDLPRHHYAIATSSLGYIYSVTNYPDSAIEFMIKAAIADIKTATKETVALRNLANLLFQKGDKKRAYRYIVLALEDATFYNARQRKIEIATILPIIEGERLVVVEAQKQKLIVFIVALTILSLLVITFSVIIYRQLGRINKVKKILQSTNDHLNNINTNLVEANQIKEEYIGYFFNTNSEYIEKIDAFQKSIYRKIVSRQYDELLPILKNTNLKKERELLFRTFDQIFLKLFPNFIKEFNLLFPEKDRIVLKKDDLLNSELRIFALIRLGIHDSEKIAKFLNFSVTTIYTYKTKVKSKSLYRDQFEDKIMEIKTIL